MISVMVWVFFMVGDSRVPGEPPAYEQVTTSELMHSRWPGAAEGACAMEFALKHPHHVVCDSGWCQQEVKVWPV